MASIYLLAPVMSEQVKPIEHPVLIHLVFFILTILAAPIVIYSTIVPSATDSFKEHLAKGLFEQV